MLTRLLIRYCVPSFPNNLETEIDCENSVKPLLYNLTVNDDVINDQILEFANKLSTSGNYTLLVTGYFQKPENKINTPLTSQIDVEPTSMDRSAEPNYAFKQGYKYTAKANFEVSIFTFQLVLNLENVLEKQFYWVDEPINVNSSIKI